MDERVLKELVEVNSQLRELRAEIKKLLSLLIREEEEKAASASATSFHKRS